ncbi:MAG: hypothetical protein SGI83_07655 [Bacteroidota bacterium]|nr:hypothetical protein [Bacteroidota bacterium]
MIHLADNKENVLFEYLPGYTGWLANQPADTITPNLPGIFRICKYYITGKQPKRNEKRPATGNEALK